MGGEKLETVQQFKTLLQRELKKWHTGWQKQKGEKEEHILLRERL